MIIFHDKLTEFGGAEVVLKELVLELSPNVIYTTCVNTDIDWDSIYKTKILSPKVLFWIDSQKKYRFFYPFICFATYFYKMDKTLLDKVVVYSSSAAKFFSLKGVKQVVFYSNYPAKPLIKYSDYLQSNSWLSSVKLFLFNMLKSIWTKVELTQLRKYPRINVISELSKQAYLSIYGDSLPSINIIHCPSKVDFDGVMRINKTDVDKEKRTSVCLVSRLYPEKTLESLLEYLQAKDSMKVSVIGDGPLLSSFKSKYTNINFCGFLSDNDKFQIIKSSDIVFVPTAQEWSLVTVESNLVGTPVIAKYSKAIEEINFIISNSKNQPNLMYKSIEEIDNLMPLIYKSREVLEKNKKTYVKYFSNDRFISELCNNFKEI